MEDHQEVREYRLRLPDDGRDLRRQVRVADLQRLPAAGVGVFVFTQDTLEPVGYLPNFGGHHDCVIVPTKVEHLLNSRCTTL